MASAQDPRGAEEILLALDLRSLVVLLHAARDRLDLEAARGRDPSEIRDALVVGLASLATAGFELRGVETDPRGLDRYDHLALYRALHGRSGDRHAYVSTYCQHGECERCRRVCKVCEAPCLCSHHSGDDPTYSDWVLAPPKAANVPPTDDREGAEDGGLSR